MERTVGTSLLLQMMRNRVYEVENEYYLYLNAVEDKLLERETISHSEWQSLFNESGLPKEEQHNFNKVFIEAYTRYYFFKEALKDLPNTTDINTVRRIITVDDLAYPSILKLKLAYVYGNQITNYDSLITKWVTNEYVVKWLEYKSYRKLDDYWDMDFANDNSVFMFILNYKREHLEGLDNVEDIFKKVETLTMLRFMLRFNMYCYNDMPLAEVTLNNAKEEYIKYVENTEDLERVQGIFQETPYPVQTVNAFSLRLLLELCIIQKEKFSTDTLSNNDKSYLSSILKSYLGVLSYSHSVIRRCLEERMAHESVYFYENSECLLHKNYLMYAMKHCEKFPNELVPEFDKLHKEEYNKDDFISITGRIWKDRNLNIEEVWITALMYGFYIPRFVKRTLRFYCNTNELLMNLTINDICDRKFLTVLVSYYITNYEYWNVLKRSRLESILYNGFVDSWCTLVKDNVSQNRFEVDSDLLVPALSCGPRYALYKEYNCYLMSNNWYGFYYSNFSKDKFIHFVNFRLFLESRLYGCLISIEEVRDILRNYPKEIITSLDEILKNGITKVSRESIDLVIDCCITHYIAFKKLNFKYNSGDYILGVKNDFLKSLPGKEVFNNTKAADIFFGKVK